MRLTILVLGLLFSIGGLTQIPSEGLLAYYPFLNSTDDYSLNSNHAIQSGCEYVIDREGNQNAAILLNDTTDFIELPWTEFTPFSGDFTLCYWMKTSKQNRSHLMSLGYWIGGDDEGGNFQITTLSGTTVHAYWNGLGENALISAETIQLCNNRWHHVVFKREEGDLQWWVDRQLIQMASYSTNQYTEDIGTNESVFIGNTPHPFRGVIDEIMFYNRALSEDEIFQIYHHELPINLIHPRLTDVYPVNSPCLLEWNCHSEITSLNIDYSLDGNTWNNLEENYPVNQSTYSWHLNFEPFTKLWIRVSNSENASQYKTVGPFRMAEYVWEDLCTSCDFLPRDGAGLLNFNNKMWLLGGWNPFVDEWLPGYTTNEIWSSSDGINWNFETFAPWTPRHTAGWLVYDDKLWVIGGDWNSGIQQMDVWNSSDGINWELVIDPLPMDVRMTHMVAELNNEIILFGGQTLTFGEFTGSELYNDVWSSNNGIEWQQISQDAGWYPRGQIQGNFIKNDTLWLIGGGTYDARYIYSDVWFTTNGSEWERITEAAEFLPRQYHEVAVFDNRLWVLGGYEGLGNRNDVWFSDDGSNWHELKNTPWPARHAGAVCSFDSSLWMVSGNLWNDSWRLNRIADSPNSISEINNPEILIYPNPCHNYLIINDNYNLINYEISSLEGKIIRSSNEKYIDLSDLSNGIYCIKIFDGKKISCQKFIKNSN